MKKKYNQLTAWSSALLLAASAVNSAYAVTYDTNTTFSSSPAWSENVSINSGVTVTLGENVLIGQTKDITIDVNGSLVLNSSKTDNHGSANSFIIANNKALQFTGTGTLVHNGTGRLAMQSSGYKGAGGYSIKFAFSDGALIDIQKGTLVNGGWNTQNWSSNKADLRIASGAALDVWDGTNMKVDSLVGSGTITSGSTASRFVDFGMANSTWVVNGEQQTPEFSGTIASGKNIELHKYGTGTQILSGAYLSNGTAYVSGGTLQIGNGNTGYIGSSAGIEVRENGRLVINSNQISSPRRKFSGSGVIEVQKGTLPTPLPSPVRSASRTADFWLSERSMNSRTSRPRTELLLVFTSAVRTRRDSPSTLSTRKKRHAPTSKCASSSRTEKPSPRPTRVTI